MRLYVVFFASESVCWPHDLCDGFRGVAQNALFLHKMLKNVSAERAQSPPQNPPITFSPLFSKILDSPMNNGKISSVGNLQLSAEKQLQLGLTVVRLHMYDAAVIHRVRKKHPEHYRLSLKEGICNFNNFWY